MSESAHSEMDEPDRSDPFEADHMLVAHVLAAGGSHGAAGLEVGRSAKWVQRALREVPGLRDYVIELKQQRASEAAAALGALLPDAVEAARRALTSERISDQLRAAGLIFSEFRNFRLESAAAERMEALQEEIDQLNEAVDAMTATDPAVAP